MVNRMSSYFPKGGHSATETELKIIWTHIRCNVTESLTPKTCSNEPQQNYRFGTVSNELLGGGGGGLTPCLPTGHFLATISTPFSANGPLLGHLFGFQYFDKNTLIYMIKLL